MLKACLNGPRTRADHPRLPVTPHEVAADAMAVVAAGAEAIHVHPKDDRGADTVDPAGVATFVTAIREACPGVPLGVTTGAWIVTDPRDRLAAVRRWTVRPDFASVNWHEPGAPELADALVELGIGVEAGLFHRAGIRAWRSWPRHRHGCVRVMIELPDGLDEVSTNDEADSLLASVRATGTSSPVLLHGEGTSCWPALRRALSSGLDARIGLEDTMTTSTGDPAVDNVALVREAMGIALRP